MTERSPSFHIRRLRVWQWCRPERIYTAKKAMWFHPTYTAEHQVSDSTHVSDQQLKTDFISVFQREKA